MRLENWVEGVLRQFHRHGFEAYAVGGCVRDALLGRTPHDFDITTSALPEDIGALFEKTVEVGVFGTVCVILPEGRVEVTPFRADGTYDDLRHPDAVRFGVSLAEDLRRRDFTVNALCWDGEKVVDLVGGRKDLQDGVLRAVGDPTRRFAEDPLRILRLYRFAAFLGFSPEPVTHRAAVQCAPLLGRISAPRIGDELDKLMLSPMTEKGIEVFSLLPGGFHADRAVSDLPEDLICRWAGLFYRADKDAAFASAFLRSVHRPNRIVYGVRDVLKGISEKTDTGHLLWRYGRDNTGRILRISDSSRVREMNEFIRSGRCWRTEDLALDGRALLAAGVEPEQIGKTLEKLTEHVLRHPNDNTADCLRRMVKEYQSEQSK